jgi:hypothetical protein
MQPQVGGQVERGEAGQQPQDELGQPGRRLGGVPPCNAATTDPASWRASAAAARRSRTAPSQSTMDAWLPDYKAVGIYICGGLRACAQTNLTLDWLTLNSAYTSTAYARPDNLWFARWNNVGAVTDDKYISSTYWTNHQRVPPVRRQRHRDPRRREHEHRQELGGPHPTAATGHQLQRHRFGGLCHAALDQSGPARLSVRSSSVARRATSGPRCRPERIACGRPQIVRDQKRSRLPAPSRTASASLNWRFMARVSTKVMSTRSAGTSCRYRAADVVVGPPPKWSSASSRLNVADSLAPLD